jgi:SAM-dependent methyltransferase
MSQDRIFATGEGDRWFERNNAALHNADRLANDPPLSLLELSGVSPSHVLEVGASNGYRLEALRLRYGCRAVAVEPSPAAIKDGQRRYPDVQFLCGLASAIPIEQSGQFDLVIVHFVLHWIDRSMLLRSVAELDRMVANDGCLLIGDFYPATPERVVYHHLPHGDVWTYKQDYTEVFVASGLYSRVAALTFDHTGHQCTTDVAPENRIQVVLLRKSLSQGYPARALKS